MMRRCFQRVLSGRVHLLSMDNSKLAAGGLIECVRGREKAEEEDDGAGYFVYYLLVN